MNPQCATPTSPKGEASCWPSDLDGNAREAQSQQPWSRQRVEFFSVFSQSFEGVVHWFGWVLEGLFLNIPKEPLMGSIPQTTGADM